MTRHATIDAGRVTAEALSANLEQMKSVEQLRRVYRDLKDLKNPDSNSAPFAPPGRDTRGRRDLST
jgi:hypothetical protein